MGESRTQARELPSTFGRYRITRMIGEGGMGAVYLARDTQLDRDVALKIPQFAGNDASVLERFYQEARAAATVQHPNICPIYDVGEIDGMHYLSMAFIDGKPLEVWAGGEKSLTCRQIAALVRKVAVAMNEAHKKGVIHRDLKPANIMIDRRGEPIVMDFGLARRTQGKNQRLTQSGAVMGSPAYMSPEQVKGESDAVGRASDIYSLGVVFYELLTHRPPFVGEDNMAVLAQVLLDEPQAPCSLRPDLEPALETICLKALAKKVSERQASMAELASQLQDYLRGAAGTADPGAAPPAAGAPSPMRADAPGAGIRASMMGGLRSVARLPTPVPTLTVAEGPRRARPRRREKERGKSALPWIVSGVSLLVLLVFLVIFMLQNGRATHHDDKSSASVEPTMHEIKSVANVQPTVLAIPRPAATGRAEPKPPPTNSGPKSPDNKSPDSKAPSGSETSAGSAPPKPLRKDLVETDYEYVWRTQKHKAKQVVIDIGGGESLELVRIPNGSFFMGTSEAEASALTRLNKWKEDHFAGEKPRRKVTITRDFYLGKTHVTVGQFRRFVAATSYQTQAERGRGVYVMDDQNEWAWRKEFNWKNPGFAQTDRDPVVCVSWNDAKSFLDWLRSEHGVAATLPTEAQFEYAIRGGKSSLFFTGDTIDSLAGYANVGDLNIRKRRGDTHPLSWAPFDDGYTFTSPVSHYQPNPFGLYDITGNAREWCRDWYDTDSYSTLPANDPEQVIKPELVKMMERVTRGASWYSRPMECRTAFREKFPPDNGTSKLGFRVLVPVD